MSVYIPTPPEIDETPELAILSVLNFTLDVVSHALVAAHPEIAGEDDLPRAASAARCAECILGHAYKLKLLLASYGHFVVTGDEEPLGGNEVIRDRRSHPNPKSFQRSDCRPDRVCASL